MKGERRLRCRGGRRFRRGIDASPLRIAARGACPVTGRAQEDARETSRRNVDVGVDDDDDDGDEKYV